MAIPVILAQLLLTIGLKIAEAVGVTVARRIEARYAAIAEKHPELDESGLKGFADVVAGITRDVVGEARTMSFGPMWTKADVNHFLREGTWKEVLARAAARNILIDENYARGEVEAELLAQRMEARGTVPILTPEGSQG